MAPTLLHPVPPGDTEVEQPVGDVERDLLGPQDPDIGDPGIIDGGPVVDIGGADHPQVGRGEQLQCGPLE